MLMPKQAHLDSRIKVSSWCTLHFMTRPLSRAPLSSSQLSPGCSSHVGCGQDGGSRGSMASTVSIISIPKICISIIFIMTWPSQSSFLLSSFFILKSCGQDRSGMVSMWRRPMWTNQNPHLSFPSRGIYSYWEEYHINLFLKKQMIWWRDITEGKHPSS